PLEHAGIEGIRTGYLSNTISNITISQFMQEQNVILPYIEVHGVELVNVTEWGPVGEDVPLNEIIWLRFTHPMDIESVGSSLMFDPAITVTGYDWSPEGDKVFIHHEDLQPMTNYTITLMSTAVSEGGLPLWGPTGFSWTFRTGTDVIAWTLDSKVIEVLSDRTVNVEVQGGEEQTVFFVIVGIDSLLLEETEPGVYNGTFNGDLLEWNTTYEYYFSNSWEGPDMAPDLRGTFKTPVEAIGPIDDDDDVDDDDGDDDSGTVITASLLICGLVLLLLLVIVGVVFILTRRKGKKWEEE
ncbi:MAG: Ig-like domain-containing protein, partial [Candidatus Thermoplasmatota archaeon]|nr:Ig-like domain-containing protein [Candidatus Thermoplasmatota archaeon]